MGKITGFLEYDRQTDPAEQPLDRIEHWKEFHPRLSEADRRQQGARCMECCAPSPVRLPLGGMTLPPAQLGAGVERPALTRGKAPGAERAAEDQQFS